MLLWPSYQAEVIFATPPKGGLASPPWLKGPAFTQTKMTDVILSLHFEQGSLWRAQRILSETLQGFSRTLADQRNSYKLFFVFFFTFVKQVESLLSFAFYC